MNFYRFRWLIPDKMMGDSYHFIQWLKSQPVFKFAHFDVILPDRQADKVIVCFGQIHTVLTGKITRSTAKKIAYTQARLFTYYSFLHHEKIVNSFGVEGFTEEHGLEDFNYKDIGLQFRRHLKEREIDQLKRFGHNFGMVKKIFSRLSLLWQKTLKKYPTEPHMVGPIAGMVDGMKMLSFFDPSLKIYAIEGEKEYYHVAANVMQLQKEIRHMKQNKYFYQAQQKRFKGLNRAEAKAVKIYSMLVQRFNHVLTAPIREKAHISLALRKLGQSDITAFVMGVGHRDNLMVTTQHMLRRSKVAFLFITPQELWFWKGVRQKMKMIFWLMVIAIGLVCYFQWDIVSSWLRLYISRVPYLDAILQKLSLYY